jgi:hypothetical protein
LPRWINQLAEFSLMAAAALKRPCVDGSIIEEAFAELQLTAKPVLRCAA